MTAIAVVLCRCGHALRMHEREVLVDGSRGACMHGTCPCAGYTPAASVDADTPAAAADDRYALAHTKHTDGAKRCPKCQTSKPVEDFYLAAANYDGLGAYCKDCNIAVPRRRTTAKILRVRARHRAVAELVRRHDHEFRNLLDQYTAEAAVEHEQLTSVSAAAVYPAGETVRLRPGQRRPKQTVADRIDVARCPECVQHHDRGHVCTNCGAAPQSANTQPAQEETA